MGDPQDGRFTIEIPIVKMDGLGVPPPKFLHK